MTHLVLTYSTKDNGTVVGGVVTAGLNQVIIGMKMIANLDIVMLSLNHASSQGDGDIIESPSRRLLQTSTLTQHKLHFMPGSSLRAGTLSGLSPGYSLTTTGVYPERFACCKQTADKYYFAVSNYVAVDFAYPASEIRVYSFPVSGCTLQYCAECSSDFKTC